MHKLTHNWASGAGLVMWSLIERRSKQVPADEPIHVEDNMPHEPDPEDPVPARAG